MVVSSLAKMTTPQKIVFAGKQYLSYYMGVKGKINTEARTLLGNFLEMRFNLSNSDKRKYIEKSVAEFMIAYCRQTGEPLPESVLKHMYMIIPPVDLPDPQFETDKLVTSD